MNQHLSFSEENVLRTRHKSDDQLKKYCIESTAL